MKKGLESVGAKLREIRGKIALWVVKKDRLTVIFALLVVVLLILIKFLKHADIAILDLSTFSAVVISAAASVFIMKLRVYIYNRIEDPAKLTKDYNGLVSRYSIDQKNMVKAVFPEGKQPKKDDPANWIPVIECVNIAGKELRISDDASDVYSLPPSLIPHFEELMGAHSTSNIYNNLNIRVTGWEEADGVCTVHTGRTTYFSSLVTNRSMDFLFGNNLTVRELFECGPRITPLETSSLSNHLGFNGILESSDGYCAFVYRKDDVSIAKRTYGTAIGASLKTKYALNEDGVFTLQGLAHGIQEEVTDELKLKASDITETRVLCAYRDLLEGGKPQFFVYFKCDKSWEEIESLFAEGIQKAIEKLMEKRDQKNGKRELRKTRKKLSKSIRRKDRERQMLIDGEKLVWISRKDLLGEEIEIRSDGVTATCYSKGKSGAKKEHMTLPMVPSAAASVVFLRDYLLKEKKSNGND